MSFSPNASLKPYLSRCNNSSLYVYTSRLIAELALLGCTDVAGRLLSRLNNYDFYHGYLQHGKLRDLWFLWDLRAKEDGAPWPEGEEEKVRRAVRERRAKMKSNEEGMGDDETVTLDDMERELELVAKESATSWYYPNKMPGSQDRAIALDPYKLERPPITYQMLDAARDIIHNFETAGSASKIGDVRSSLVSALDLVLSAEAHHEKHGMGEALHLRGAPTSDELLRWLAHSLGEKYYETPPATESRQAWKLYKSGALRQQLNVDDTALTAFAEDFERALTERLTNGRSRPSANLSVPELLRAAEHNTQAIKANPKVQENYYQVDDTSLFNSAATREQIAEAEARLNTALPSDYTTFLRRSNGTIGHIWGHPLCDYQPPLHPVDKLRWLDPTSEDYFTGLSLDMPARWDRWPFAPPPTAPSYGGYGLEHFVIGCALEIGTEGIDNTWLIPPSTIIPIKEAVKKVLEDESLGEVDKNSVRAAVRDFAGSEEGWEEMEWACVTWASGGTAAMFVYPGFKAYLEDVVERGRVTGEVKDEDENEGKKMLQSGKWLGRLFRKGDEGEEPEMPEWLRDAIRAALPPKRSDLTDKV